MNGDFTSQQKKAIGNYIVYQLRRRGLSQVNVARSRGCSEAAINTVVWQNRPMHTGLGGLKDYVARKAGYNSWREICAEALAQETVQPEVPA